MDTSSPSGASPVPSPNVPSGPLPEAPQSHAWVWYTVSGIIMAATAALFLYFIFVRGSFIPGIVEKEPILLGGVLPLSGDAASFGVPIQQAAMLAADAINAEGGIAGRMIEWRFADGKCDSDAARLAAEEILLDGKVQFLIGGACSSEFLSVAPIAQGKSAISFSPSATNPQVSALGGMVFRSAPSDAFAGIAAARYAADTFNAKTAAVVAENTLYATGLRDVFVSSFAEEGGVVLVNEQYETDTTDFKDIVAKIAAAKPDVVYILPQTPTPGILIVKGLKEANGEAKLLTAEVLLMRDSIAEQGTLLEGVTGIEPYFDESNETWKQFLAQFTARYGDTAPYPPDVAGVRDFVYLLKEAIEATDGTPASVANHFYSIRNWAGAMGVLSFDENGDAPGTYRIIRARSGEVETIDTYSVSGN